MPDYNSLCRKATISQFVLKVERLSVKNWAKFGSSDFEALLYDGLHLMYLAKKCLDNYTQIYSCQATMLGVTLWCNIFFP